MNSSITPKSTLRRGKFKKILQDEDLLKAEAGALSEKLSRLHHDYQLNLISSAEYCGLWLITYLRARHPYGWWGAHRKESLYSHRLTRALADYPYFDFDEYETEKLAPYKNLGLLLNHRAFRATPQAVHRAILAWSDEAYDLVLMDRIPSVQEVLKQQIQGKRCVTLFHQEKRLSQLVLGERDPLSFGMHDLIHADHFFHANGDRSGQIGFYRIIHRLLNAGLLTDFFQVPGFEERLEYLMSDMNSHPLHLWKCFRAICDISFKEKALILFNTNLPQVLESTPLVSHALSLLNKEDFVLQVHGVALTDMCQEQGH